ncbi:MAG: alpha-galactosidase, partial [Lentisphaeria bacterium]|nr:alpha-galactosidase [Lentisphaeria bacterium]
SVPIPRACLGFFRGDAVDGSNALRRHINENVRRDDSPPPVFYNHFFGMRRDWTVEDHLYEARVYAELGIEYYVVDAEWHKGDFRVGIGNWEIEDKRRFPDGMAAFADHVRALGMKFGSWIEIEWAMANSHWGRKHPDWFATIPGRYYHYGGGELQDRLLRVCDPKVRAAVADFLEQWVEKYGIEWVRWDMNNAPARFWALEDPKGQCGWGHLGYGEGLYALLDEFMRRCPQVHIESCAAGGHRMDLGTLRRGHSAWMSDKTDTHDVTRRIQTGLNRVLPGCYGNSSFIWATHPLQRSQTLSALKKDGYPPAALRSRMGGTLGFAENARFFTPAIKETLRQEIANYKVQRHLLMKDFYPLFDPRRLAEYDGWQFHDPETGEGFFQVFRCKAPQSQTEVRLRGLLPGLEYVLRDVDTRRQRNLRGGAAMRIRIADVDGVKWYQYHPA